MGKARLSLPFAAGALAFLAALPAAAGCASGCASCCLPQAHTVQIPGVVITPPTTTLGGAAGGGSGCSGCGGVGGGGWEGGGSGGSSNSDSGSSSQSSSSSNSSTSTSSSASASSYGQATAYGATSNSATVANLLASGGGSSFYVDQGPSSTIGTLNVETPPAPASAPPVCLEYASALLVAAVQATCLDDKDVPHPASQVMPGREVADGYTGEVFRCISGSRMQYVVGSFAGQPDFGHGQTIVCRKGDALWREGAGGRLQCRPQTPARDCNERSLLRRYGAGIKVMRAVGGGQCVRWGGGQSVAAGPGGAVTGMLIDGGVGGVAH